MRLKLNLDTPRRKAAMQIDALVEAVRVKIVTPGSGQAMVYQQKYEEALAFASDPAIAQAEVPHVYAEVGITAPTAYEVAQVILNLRSLWRDLSAQLEQLRLSAKKRLETAATAAAIEQIVVETKAELEALPVL